MAKNKGLMDFVMKNIYKGGTESIPFYNKAGYSGYTGSPVDDYNIGLGLQNRRADEVMWDNWDNDNVTWQDSYGGGSWGAPGEDLIIRAATTPYGERSNLNSILHGGLQGSTEGEWIPAEIDDYFRSVLSGRRLPHMTAPSGAFGQWSGYGAGSMPDENRMARYQEELDY